MDPGAVPPVVARLAADVAAADPDWPAVLFGLLGGLALFLFGLERLTTSLRSMAGDRLRRVLTSLTGNRFAGIATGTGVTALVQSSSVTTVLVVGFVGAGIMTFPHSLGVLLGAKIGTTVTAQVIAFDVRTGGLALLAIGFGLATLAPGRRWRRPGDVLLGLGLVFLGMQVMGDGVAPLRDYEPFVDAMARLEVPLLGFLAGAAFTALVQSSTATVGVAIALSGQGLVGLDAGVALVLGANAGTCVTAALAAIGRSREAVRVAVAHVLFNLTGALLWVGFVDQLAELARWISPSAPELTGADRIAAETPRQLANAHAIFNVANTLLFVGLLGPIARLIERLVPDRPEPPARVPLRPEFLQPEALENAPLALEAVRRELGLLAADVTAMVRSAPAVVLRGDERAIDELEDDDDPIDARYGFVVDYLRALNGRALEPDDADEVIVLLEAANDLESIGDVIETNVVAQARRRLANDVVVSPATAARITEVHEAVLRALEGAVAGIVDDDRDAAERVAAMKADVHRIVARARAHQVGRLGADEPGRVEAYTVEVDVIDQLSRVYYFAKRIARARLGLRPGVLEDEPPAGTPGPVDPPGAVDPPEPSPDPRH